MTPTGSAVPSVTLQRLNLDPSDAVVTVTEIIIYKIIAAHALQRNLSR